MKTILLILIPLSSFGQFFAEPSLTFTGRLNFMPAVDVGYQSGYCDFAASVSYETGVNMPTYAFRTGYTFETGDYSTTMLTLQLGAGWTQNCGGKLEGPNQWTGLLGLKVHDTQSRCGFLARYMGGTIGLGFSYRF